MGSQDGTVNDPLVSQIASPPLFANPGSHVTTTDAPVVPEIEFAPDLSEFGTCVGVQLKGSHVTLVKTPVVWHWTLPPGPYPALQLTVTV